MRRITVYFIALAAFAVSAPAVFSQQKFDVPAKGVQTFNLKDERGRNQATFRSKAPLEDISGTASGLAGTVSFDPANVPGSIKAQITVDVSSLKTGIDMRDGHLRGAGWLDAEKYPTINFTLSKFVPKSSASSTEISGLATGDFLLHGVVQQVELLVSLTYLPASDKTKARAPGDLLVLRARGKISLSKAGVKNEIVGVKVSDDIEIEFNAVGSNATK